MGVSHPRKPHADHGGGQPRTLTSGPPNTKHATSRGDTTTHNPGWHAAHRFFDGSEDVDHCDSRLAELSLHDDIAEFEKIADEMEEEDNISLMETLSDILNSAIGGDGSSSAEELGQPPQIGEGNEGSMVGKENTEKDRESVGQKRNELDNAGEKQYGKEKGENSSSAIPAIQALPNPTVYRRNTVGNCQEKPKELEGKKGGQDTTAPEGIKGSDPAIDESQDARRNAGQLLKGNVEMFPTVHTAGNYEAEGIAPTESYRVPNVPGFRPYRRDKELAGTETREGVGSHSPFETADTTTTLGRGHYSCRSGTTMTRSPNITSDPGEWAALLKWAEGAEESYNPSHAGDFHTPHMTARTAAFHTTRLVHCVETAPGGEIGVQQSQSTAGGKLAGADTNPLPKQTLQETYRQQIEQQWIFLPHLNRYSKIQQQDGEDWQAAWGQHYGWGQSMGAIVRSYKEMEWYARVFECGDPIDEQNSALLAALVFAGSGTIQVGGRSVRALNGLPTPPHDEYQLRGGWDPGKLLHGRVCS